MKNLLIASLGMLWLSSQSMAQDILPFPPTPSASTPGVTIQSSTHKNRVEPKRLPNDAPNILIVLIDDAGNGTPSTFGGEVHTPTLDRIAGTGIAYNRFHTTAQCSPTRASMLTGRNHTRIGNGAIAEVANDFDGFSGRIPKSSATIAEVLKNYGYNTAAFGKWHNTPAKEISSKGPFDNWPTGYGFEYFYGFLAGQASQYEPLLVRNTNYVERPETSGGNDHYHFSEDMADDAIRWLREQRTYAPDKPWFIWWTPGATHGPHHVMKEWADKYKGKFDDGWDAYRERVFENQKELGWIPADAVLTPRPSTMASWDSIPESQRPFQSRLMEVFAGFTEHVDAQVGRVVDEIDAQGELDNTIVLYVWGDNGSSAEGIEGTISDQITLNLIPSTIDEQMQAVEELGGLDVLGTAKADNMFHAGWAWAGSTPYKGTKLQGSYFGGIRNPLAISWPKKIKADKSPRPQFHHVIDVAPTIYELLEITPPQVVNGFSQDSIDGVSMAYSFDDPAAEGQRTTQFFDIMASRGIYHDGWFAGAPGPRLPWVGGAPEGIHEWSPLTEKWQLYHIDEDWTQSKDLAASHPEKLEEMKALFLTESAKNKNLPIGGAFWSTAAFHPEDAPSSPLTEWSFLYSITDMPEVLAPRLGKVGSVVSMAIEVPEQANGVLYALGGFSGGLACYVIDNELHYEFNLFQVRRTKIKAEKPLAPGKRKIEVETKLADEIGGPLNIILRVDGKEVAKGTVPNGLTLQFSANGSFDIGIDRNSPVSLDYYDEEPFPFNGEIGRTDIRYTDTP